MLRVARTRAWHDFDCKEQVGRGPCVHASRRNISLQRSLRETHAVCLSYPSFTMAAAPVTEEQPQVSVDDNDNDVDDSDEEGAPEIAAADGQSHVISALCHP
jgi:hypothetical protein